MVTLPPPTTWGWDCKGGGRCDDHRASGGGHRCVHPEGFELSNHVRIARHHPATAKNRPHGGRQPGRTNPDTLSAEADGHDGKTTAGTGARTDQGGREVELQPSQPTKLIGTDEQPTMWMPCHQGSHPFISRGRNGGGVGDRPNWAGSVPHPSWEDRWSR